MCFKATIKDDTTIVLIDNIVVTDTITIGQVSGLIVKAESTSWKITPAINLSGPVLRIGNPTCASKGLIDVTFEGIEFSDAKAVSNKDNFGRV